VAAAAAKAATGTAWGGLTNKQAEQLLARALPLAKRGSVPGLRTICSMQCVRRVVDTSAVVRVLDSALVCRGLRACRQPTVAAELLLQLPAAAGIGAGDLARLCGGVVEQCDGQVCEELLQLLLRRGSLPGPEELVSLINACLQNKTDRSAAACIQLLCKHPATQQVDGSEVQQLLLDAIEAQQPAAMQAVLECLPAAAAPTGEQGQQLLCATVSAALGCCDRGLRTHSWLEAVEAAAGVAAVHGIAADVLLQLLRQAVKQGAAGIMRFLVEVKTLQQPKKVHVGSLLELAVRQQQYAGVQVLLQLPSTASSLSAKQMAQLLQASVQKDDQDGGCVVRHAVCTAPAATANFSAAGDSCQAGQVTQVSAAAVQAAGSIKDRASFCCRAD
jgi:hypothetical protein